VDAARSCAERCHSERVEVAVEAQQGRLNRIVPRQHIDFRLTVIICVVYEQVERAVDGVAGHFDVSHWPGFARNTTTRVRDSVTISFEPSSSRSITATSTPPALAALLQRSV
jgi:hypothetical protein